LPDGETIDICAILAADPNSPLGMFDCDGGGIDNATECENGGDPDDPNDECQSIIDGELDICAILAADPNNPIGALDCDEDGFTNAEECNSGSDPNNGCDFPDNGGSIDICAILAENPDSPLAALDCDGDGFSNIDECNRGSDPNDGCSIPDGETYDICAILAADPNNPLGMQDCDGGGIDNATECETVR